MELREVQQKQQSVLEKISQYAKKANIVCAVNSNKHIYAYDVKMVLDKD